MSGVHRPHRGHGSGSDGRPPDVERVLPALDPDTSTCTYDRANIGQSDPAPTPRTAADVVTDSMTRWQRQDERRRTCLSVIHLGGIFTQLFAAEHPDEVAGLVLVESNHPDEARDFQKHLTPEQIKTGHGGGQRQPGGHRHLRQLRPGPRCRSLPEVPLIVVTATRKEGWPPGWDPTVFDKLRAAQQEDLATRARWRTGDRRGSGHNVPMDRPTVVAPPSSQHSANSGRLAQAPPAWRTHDAENSVGTMAGTTRMQRLLLVLAAACTSGGTDLSNARRHHPPSSRPVRRH